MDRLKNPIIWQLRRVGKIPPYYINTIHKAKSNVNFGFVRKKRISGRIGGWQKMVGATRGFFSEIELLLCFAQKIKFFGKRAGWMERTKIQLIVQEKGA